MHPRRKQRRIYLRFRAFRAFCVRFASPAQGTQWHTQNVVCLFRLIEADPQLPLQLPPTHKKSPYLCDKCSKKGVHVLKTEHICPDKEKKD
jgi:hypothetical protein